MASLHPQVSGKGLSLGNRSCLALAQRLDFPAVTAEHVRAELAVDITISSSARHVSGWSAPQPAHLAPSLNFGVFIPRG